MLTRSLMRASLAAALGGALWAFAPAPASALMPAAPLADESAAPAQVEQAYWVYRHRYYRHRYYHRRHCWRGYYGRLHCRW